MKESKICILGAGPGGIATALKLNSLGIESTLIDKAKFPRDKICGDAVSGKVVWGFNRIDEAIMKGFRDASNLKIDCWGIEFIFSDTKLLRVPMPVDPAKTDVSGKKAHGFVSKRLAFDNYLIDWVRKAPKVSLEEELDVHDIEREGENLILKSKSGEHLYRCQLLILATGAHTRLSRKLADLSLDPKHYAGAIRAYYKGVKGLDPHGMIELHYVKEFLPGYLWIFPLANGEANVGAGMLKSQLSRRGINLKTTMLQLLKEHPRFKDRFAEAELVDEIRGFGLPLGSKKQKLSGDGFMLVGDAGSLIDPLTGEGIGNAVISGIKAAEQAAECLAENDFSAERLKAYDKAVYQKLWQELRLSHQLQRAFNYGWLVKFFTGIALRNKRFTEVMTAMFTDIDLRKKLRQPQFYLKLLLNR